MPVELTEKLLSEAAGWEVMKMARAYLQQGQVLSSHWGPPLLRGVVQAGEVSFRASMVIKSPIDIENLCTCRDAREWGKICAHGVAVGLHWLKSQQSTPPSSSASRGLATRPVALAPPRKASSLQHDPSGEPTELLLILPPNFEQALARGKIMLVFEARWGGGKSPLNALPKGRAFAFSTADQAIIERIESLANGETPALLQLDLNQFESLLPLLVAHPNITIGKSKSVAVSSAPGKLPLRATLQTDGQIVLELKQKANLGLKIGRWIWQNDTFQPLVGAPALGDLFHGPVRIARPHVPRFLSQDWPQLLVGGSVEANFKVEDFCLEPQSPRFLLELRGGLSQLSALLQCAYGSRIMTVGVTAADESVWLPDPEVATRYSTRDLNAERAALARLQRSGFFMRDGKLQLTGQNAVLNFFARDFPKLQREWNVTLEEKLERSTHQSFDRIEPQFRITSGIQWFDLGVVFASRDGETFAPADIQRLLLSGQSHTRLKSGKLALIDTGAVEELQEVLLDCAPQQHAQGYRINNTQAGFLESTLRQHNNWQVQAPAPWRERAAQQHGEAKLECPPLGQLENVLRPYQKQGVAWLAFLRANGFGGILADEMGLGKTLQALAFVRSCRSIKNHNSQREVSTPHPNPLPSEGERGTPRTANVFDNQIVPADISLSSSGGEGRGEEVPSTSQAINSPPVLVVCPTSLVYNWVAEAAKFTPDLKVLALHGPDRHSLFDTIPLQDLIITSYALIRRDGERYRGLEFDTVILDEAQHIKNRETQNAQAVKAVASRHRLVLTGTPLENSVLDLWSIFDFLMPGYLGSAKDFRERYELPITREKSEAAQTRLARRLRPFMLRRLKKEVAPELPARLEQVSFCELTAEQRTVYQQVIEASRKEVLAAGGPQGMAKSRMVVLSALLRLRQVCCDLRLLKLEGVDPANASGKLDLFSELLEEVIDGGHRLLVFSQFVSMLALIKERLGQEDIDYCYLDGSTIDRAGVVSRFQTSTDIPVFLISLKAGGVGLNLTGADTVFHFDPWWNPAVEDQATDRAHRIGQTKVVTSYKLIARDTVEEKILALQNRKREIIQSTIGSDEEFAASLSWDEIQQLLS
ncbi:MAG TPA: SNF2-related protein [Candidatus Limnocylindrales bacterium]|jgi:SNF2 family DNA or RNA helicase|nr:SNF2-related protein [Candidatus Limnocylindrales bacterium]